jgi:GNAT superfamily N-acetyltransferase
MEAEIGPLAQAEAARASRMLARAFADDPIITHFLDDPVRRQIAIPAFFEGVLEEMLPSGQVFAAQVDDRIAGVAAWLPPEPRDPEPAALARAQQSQGTVRAMFPGAADALYDGFERLAADHPHEAHWYLAFVGVDPSAQGHGLGRALMAPALAAADAARVLCYLETPFPRTHAFYERLGFIKRAELFAFNGPPHGVWAFVRTPPS